MTQMRTLRFSYLLFAIICLSCSHTFKVVSEPVDAEVYVVNPKTSDRKLVGKTPLEMPMEEMREKVGEEILSGGFFGLSIEKSGFSPQTFQLPASQFGTLLTELNVTLTQGEKLKEQKTAKNLIDRMFLAQRFAVTQQYERALIELDKILSEFPEFARALSMKGSVYFAQKNFAESLKFYEKALAIDPQMEDTVKMLAKARDMQSGRAPAANSGAPAANSGAPAANSGAPAANSGAPAASGGGR